MDKDSEVLRFFNLDAITDTETFKKESTFEALCELDMLTVQDMSVKIKIEPIVNQYLDPDDISVSAMVASIPY